MIIVVAKVVSLVKIVKKDVLLDVLPVDICCKVSEFFGCWKCEWMKEKEEEMFNRYIDKDNTYTKPELQILFFRLFNKSILLEPVICHEREMKKEIDRLFDNEKARDRFDRKVYLQAIKSYCKKICIRYQPWCSIVMT